MFYQPPVKPVNAAPAGGARKKWGAGAQDSWDDWDEFGLEDFNKNTNNKPTAKFTTYAAVPSVASKPTKKHDFDDDDFLK